MDSTEVMVSPDPTTRQVPDRLEALVDALRALLGDGAVSTDLSARERASVDGAPMSPILAAQLPLGLADIVVFVKDPATVPEIIALAVGHGIPITPRGKGTGNYGQAIPLHGGVVLDLSRASRILEVGDGFITAEAGATLIAMEKAARKTGQQLWMYPSTTGSSIGGFLAGGSGGTGSIAHGSNDSGFVVALDVVHGWTDPQLISVEGERASGYVHAYGVTGIILRATVKLEPAQEWSSLYASFDTFAEALPAVRDLGRSSPSPRLVSADVPFVANVLPSDPEGIPSDRASLRAIVDPDAVDAASALIESHGGRVEVVRPGFRGSVKLSMLSYNHPTYHLQKSDPDRYFHLEVGGEALFDRIDDVHAVFPGSMLHIEAAHTVPIGMLNALYESPEQVAAGITRLQEIGVGVHSPHQYYVDYKVDSARALAAVNDPAGLLNPGKLVT
ncbi:FAD/FMN-containing dehydrogenase [Nakamurella sp. UYEF19]|uniref:FAD-binding oxidoreductase n=1 Tax=Nakamurella sp. UYEF19 TaxID=1756392 RepID=UPI00339759F3